MTIARGVVTDRYNAPQRSMWLALLRMSGLPQALQNGNSQDDGDLSAQCLSKQHAAGFAEDVQVGVQPFQNDDGLLEGD